MILNRAVSRILSLMVLLALLDVCICSYRLKLFELPKEHLTAKEGSCITIECTVNGIIKDKKEPLWFWMKNAQWDDEKQKYSGTIIVSSNPEDQTPASDLAPRVKFLGSRNFKLARKGDSCGLLIHNLQKTDSGIYKFRYMGKEKWMTEPGLNLTVEDEPCRVNVNNQPAFKESDHVTIKCSTFGLCGSYPEVTGLSQTIQPSHNEEDNIKITEVSFNASWMDDGRVLSCQPLGTKDKCMVRDIKLTVEYAPKETISGINSSDIKEDDNVILTCSSRGHPNATYNWYKENSLIEKIEATFKISSIKPEDSGKYHCEAVNKHGTNKSEAITLNVKYAPKEVSVVTDDMTTQYKEGSNFKLICEVNNGNPSVYMYSWYKDSVMLTGHESTYNFTKLEPEHTGKYQCEGKNEAGSRRSPEHQINVQYVPRNTYIAWSGGSQVKVGSSFSLTCVAQAYPAPSGYTWYYSSEGQSQWTELSQTGWTRTLSWEKVALENHGCYMCSVTNDIGTGQQSSQSCIDVLYGPSKPVLSMVHSAQEGHRVNISCTVRSLPASGLTLSWTPRHSVTPMSGSPSLPHSHKVTGCVRPSDNVLWCTFNATLLHDGVYACTAENSEGANHTEQELEITYSPKDVRALVHPDTVLNENTLLSFICTARSNPRVTTFTWVQTIGGETMLVRQFQNFTVNSTTPSHSGLYSCTAQNSLGTGKSQQVEVKVKYAPKYTEIIHNMTTMWQSEGSIPVALSCHSHSYPPVNDYKWFKLMEDGDIIVGKHQNITVKPETPGTYYCIATNTLGLKASNRIQLFLRRVFFRVLFQVSIFVGLLLVALISVLFYRYKKNSFIQQGTSRKLLCCIHFGVLGWRNGTTENLVEDPQASSRDDPWPGVPYRPEPHPQTQDPQPSRALGPDST
uniref:B-cell receptor CD22 n=3 Tax=Esox lucius TaxID=8010 RepID=A0A6Q2YWD7_ESOLU